MHSSETDVAYTRPGGMWSPNSAYSTSYKQSACENCGRSHRRRRCPAIGSTCFRCGKKDHWSYVCREKVYKNKPGQKKYRRVQHYEEIPESVQASVVKKDTVSREEVESVQFGDRKDEAFVDLRLHGRETRLKIDTGAKINVMRKEVLER